MKIYTQAYVRGNVEAAEMYRKAFGAEISFQNKHFPVITAQEETLCERYCFRAATGAWAAP